ncbi:helix-turn-helix domain-containing protein [Streptomyces fragilis]|uniref:Helix-turn-helix transcriptional regulator n=1 Tax=Streptomyces fragilis TaxID=67301 RepID=A0ABV2YCP8_9ACTN|nr:helix-turn-helix transcriptional regulator [Streptomyces fragilis]
MDDKPHRPSCAQRLREDAAVRGEPVQETAHRIHTHCGVTLLRAHRLARGLTLQEAADGLNALGVRYETAPRADGDQLGHWEKGRQPRPATVDLLCEFYATTAQDLGLRGSSQPSSAEASATQERVPARRSPQTTPAVSPRRVADTVPLSFEQQIDAARRSVDRTLAVGTVTPTQLDLLDEQLLWAREQYVYTPPAPMIEILLGHLSEVEDLAAHRQPASVQVRLAELTAMIATLIADALMKLGHLRQSQSWYATARNAADDSGNTELRARVRAQAAMLPYHYGPIEAAVALSREARILCRNRPTATAAFASAAEARALAKLGHAEGAETALRQATEIFERSHARTDTGNDAFAFPERRLLLYMSGTLTALRRTAEARRVQESALALYPEKTGIDPALLHFEAALCLAHEHSTEEACQLAAATFLRTESAHRTPIVEERAREVVEVLPPRVRGSRAARELREILALPPGQM